MIGEYSVMKLKQRPLKFSVGVGDPKPFDEDNSHADTLQDSDSDTASPIKEGGDPMSLTPRQLPRMRGANKIKMLQSEQVRSTDSDSNQPLSDESSGQPSMVKKSVAIDTSQNEHFTHCPLPLQSQEFDNVMNQVIQTMLGLSNSTDVTLHIYTHAHMTHAHIYTHAHMTHIHTCTRDTYTCTHIHTCTHDTHTHTHIHTCTHYIHTHSSFSHTHFFLP